MQGKINKSQVIGVVLAIIGLMLLLSSFVLPWWGMHTESTEKDSTGEVEYHYESGGGVSVASGIGYSGGGTSLYGGDFLTPKIFGITTLFLIMALIFTTLMIISIFIKWLGGITRPKMPMILGVLAMIFCLLAPIIFMTGLPGALKADAEKRAEDSGDEYEEPDHNDPTKSFFGSYEDKEEDEYSVDNTKHSWGGDIGWIFAIISFVLILISVIMVRPKRPRIPPTIQAGYEPPPPQPTQPVYEPPPPPPTQPQYEPPPPPPSPYEPSPSQYDRTVPIYEYEPVAPQDQRGYQSPSEYDQYPPGY